MKRIFQRLGLIIGAVVLSVLLCEVGLRVLARSQPEIAFLARADAGRALEAARDLKEFVAQLPGTPPHADWQNYWTNSAGFNDREFSPPGSASLRIMALGDSFCFGMVQYPDAVQTLVEQFLNERYDQPVEVLNCGVAATGMWEYRKILELGSEALLPDLVVLHVYLGNDGPDLFHRTDDIPTNRFAARSPTEVPPGPSYLWNYLQSLRRVRGGLEAAPQVPARDRSSARGGERVDPHAPPISRGPTFTPDVYQTVMASELGRFWLPPDDGAEWRAWRPLLQELEEIQRLAEAQQMELAVVLYPSRLQVYPEFTKQQVERLRDLEAYADLQQASFDLTRPSQVLAEHCARRGIPIYDVTSDMVTAAREGEPLYIERDTHWNERGNRVAALAEARFLASLLTSRSGRVQRPGRRGGGGH